MRPNYAKSTSTKLPRCVAKSPPKASQNDMALGHRGCTKFERMHRKPPIQQRSRRPSSRSHLLWTVCPKKSTKCSKSRKICKNKSTYPPFCSKHKKATLRTWKTSTKRSKGAEGLHDTIESTSNAFLEDTEMVSASHAASAAAYRVPRSWQSWDLLLQVVPFCMFCGSIQRHWMPLLICGSL